MRRSIRRFRCLNLSRASFSARATGRYSPYPDTLSTDLLSGLLYSLRSGSTLRSSRKVLVARNADRSRLSLGGKFDGRRWSAGLLGTPGAGVGLFRNDGKEDR